MFETILTEKKDGIAKIIINRPESSNAFASNTYFEIRDAVNEFNSDPEVRVIQITGAGKHFSAGGDIKAFKAKSKNTAPVEPEGLVKVSEMGTSIRLCKKPVIAVVNGAAMGAGCALVLACDFRVMSPRTKLGMAFINMGLSGDNGGYYYLQKLIGTAKATEMMAMGSVITGEEAKELGLVTRYADSPETLQETADTFSKELMKKAPLAFAKQKRLAYEFFYRDLPQYLQREAQLNAECFNTQDHKEAVNAFLEKREPVFQGK